MRSRKPAAQPGNETIRSIAVDGQQLRVAVRQGSPGGIPLLLINGIGASLDLLQPFVDTLDPSLGVIRFDVPGVGGSPVPALPYRFTGLCRMIARMLSALGHERADVLGISWGGGVAQHFAAFQRSRCRRLVLVSTATGAMMVPARPGVLIRMVTPRRYLDPGYLKKVAGALYGGSARTDPARVATAMHARSRVGPPHGYLYQLTAGLGWTSLPFLPLIRQPVAVCQQPEAVVDPIQQLRGQRSRTWRARQIRRQPLAAGQILGHVHDDAAVLAQRDRLRPGRHPAALDVDHEVSLPPR